MSEDAQHDNDPSSATSSTTSSAARGGPWRGCGVSGLRVCPLTLGDARAFVGRHHRHHRAPQGGLWALGLMRGEDVVGATIVGRPVARHNDDGWTAEVTRLCVVEGVPNGCSMLYGAAWRAARALGYRRLITYTLVSEPGASLRAAGWREIGVRCGGSWSCPSRPRVDRHPTEQKRLWEAAEEG